MCAVRHLGHNVSEQAVDTPSSTSALYSSRYLLISLYRLFSSCTWIDNAGHTTLHQLPSTDIGVDSNTTYCDVYLTARFSRFVFMT